MGQCVIHNYYLLIIYLTINDGYIILQYKIITEDCRNKNYCILNNILFVLLKLVTLYFLYNIKPLRRSQSITLNISLDTTCICIQILSKKNYIYQYLLVLLHHCIRTYVIMLFFLMIAVFDIISLNNNYKRKIIMFVFLKMLRTVNFE